jgi:hypothetical protein
MLTLLPSVGNRTIAYKISIYIDLYKMFTQEISFADMQSAI